MLIVISVNTIYPIVATFIVCTKFDSTHECLDVGPLYYINFTTMIDLLNQNGLDNISQNLIILQTVVFYLLLIGNVGSLFYLSYME
jgi:hypothetical protein